MAKAEKERNSSFLERSGLLFEEESISIDVQDAGDRNIVHNEPCSKSVRECNNSFLGGHKSSIPDTCTLVFGSRSSKIVHGNKIEQGSGVSDVNQSSMAEHQNAMCQSSMSENQNAMCLTKMNNNTSRHEHGIYNETDNLATGVLRIDSLVNEPSDMLSAVCISSPNKRRETERDSLSIAVNNSTCHPSITQDSGYGTSLCSSVQVEADKTNTCRPDNILDESGYSVTGNGHDYHRSNYNETTESGFHRNEDNSNRASSLDVNCDKNRPVTRQDVTKNSCCNSDGLQAEYKSNLSDALCTSYPTSEHCVQLGNVDPSCHANQGGEMEKTKASLCNGSVDGCQGNKKKDMLPGDDFCCYEHDSCPPSQIAIAEKDEDKCTMATEIKFTFQKPIDFYRSYLDLINALK